MVLSLGGDLETRDLRSIQMPGFQLIHPRTPEVKKGVLRVVFFYKLPKLTLTWRWSEEPLATPWTFNVDNFWFSEAKNIMELRVPFS